MVLIREYEKNISTYVAYIKLLLLLRLYKVII